jgi:diacylglycerol kinase family enzyme
MERAKAAGAQVRLTGPDQDPASLARTAIAEGAGVLGVAGGDGTVSAVAAVAAEAHRPLVVIPAGTRNHFARDLGLDVSDPVSALTALRAGDPALVDLGRVGSRVFVNNVSFGVYADV